MTNGGRAALRARQLAAATSVLTALYLATYAAVVRGQDGPGVVWWYVGVLVIASVLALGAAISGRVRPVMPGCAVVLCLSAFIGLLSVGALLLPAVATAVGSAVYAARRPATP
ncbi:MAG: hypothetical protein ACOH2F_12695 [Cellulomonas sp.]